MCKPAQLNCVETISVDDNNCLQSCEGLFITGYERREFNDVQKRKILSKITEEYKNYKANESIRYARYPFYYFYGKTSTMI